MKRDSEHRLSKAEIAAIQMAEQRTEQTKLGLALKSLKYLMSVLNGERQKVPMEGDQMRRIEKMQLRRITDLGSERNDYVDFIIELLIKNGVMERAGQASQIRQVAHRSPQRFDSKIEYIFFPATARVVIPQLLLELEQKLQTHAAAPRKP